VSGETERRLKNNVTLYCLFSCLYLANLWLPVLYIYLNQFRGLSLDSIYLAAGVWWAVSVLLEVPSGAMADRFGRRNTLFISSVALVLAMILFACASTFVLLLLAYVLWALAVSFTSGADSALLYDTLAALDREDEFRRVYGRCSAMALASGSVGALVGGMLGELSLLTPILVSIALAGVQTLIAYLFVEVRVAPVDTDPGSSLLLRSIRTVLASPALFGLLLFQALVYAVMWLFKGVLYAPYLESSGINLAYVGLVLGALGLARAIGSAASSKVEGGMREGRQLVTGSLALALCLIALSLTSPGWSVILALLMFLLYGVLRPLTVSLLQHRVASDRRATISSMGSLVSSLLIAAVQPCMGWAMQRCSEQRGAGVDPTTFQLGFGMTSLLMVGALGCATYIALVIARERIEPAGRTQARS